MSLDLSLILVALFIGLYLYVWSNPKQKKIEEPVKIIDRRWHVRDRPEGGMLIVVEVL